MPRQARPSSTRSSLPPTTCATDTSYQDLGADWCQRRRPAEAHARRLAHQIEELGFRVTIEPTDPGRLNQPNIATPGYEAHPASGLCVPTSTTFSGQTLGVVTKPAQHPLGLCRLRASAAPPARADRAAMPTQQRGHLQQDFRRHVAEGSVGEHLGSFPARVLGRTESSRTDPTSILNERRQPLQHHKSQITNHTNIARPK
jgi:hypothetical protein